MEVGNAGEELAGQVCLWLCGGDGPQRVEDEAHRDGQVEHVELQQLVHRTQCVIEETQLHARIGAGVVKAG